MKKTLIVLGVSAIAAVATKVITSNVKKQKEEKDKFEFKGLFEKAAKQAAKDTVEAVKSISKESLSLIGLKVLLNIFKTNRKAFNKIAIEMGVLCGAFGILSTALDYKKYKDDDKHNEAFEKRKWLVMLIDTIMHIVHYLECGTIGCGIGWLLGCFKYKTFDPWISGILLESIIASAITSVLLMFLPKVQEN